MYTSALVPEKWQWLYMLNPAVGIVDGFRWALLGIPAFPLLPLCMTSIWIVALLVLGFTVFRNMERNFVDVI